MDAFCVVKTEDHIGRGVARQPTLAKYRNTGQIVCKECWVHCLHNDAVTAATTLFTHTDGDSIANYHYPIALLHFMVDLDSIQLAYWGGVYHLGTYCAIYCLYLKVDQFVYLGCTVFLHIYSTYAYNPHTHIPHTNLQLE